MRRHRHDWRLVGEQYNAPNPGLRTIDRATEQFLAMSVYGFTVVTYECAGCPERKFDRVIGRTADAK